MRAVTINGVTYRSISTAARELGCDKKILYSQAQQPELQQAYEDLPQDVPMVLVDPCQLAFDLYNSYQVRRPKPTELAKEQKQEKRLRRPGWRPGGLPELIRKDNAEQALRELREQRQQRAKCLVESSRTIVGMVRGRIVLVHPLRSA